MKTLILGLILLFSSALACTSPEAALAKAAEDGNIKEVRALLDSGAKINMPGAGGYTPLAAAARYGHKDMVELLLRRGAAIDRKSANGWTPLMVASYTGQVEIAELLWQKDADPNIKNGAGQTAYDIAKENKRENVLALFNAILSGQYRSPAQ